MIGARAGFAALAIAIPSLTVAATSAPERAPYRYVAVMRGQCEELVLAGHDRSATCNDELVNVDFGDGRVAFVFTTPGERSATVTTFLGRASHQDGLRDYRLEVDALSTTTTDVEGRPNIVDEAAVGQCTMVGDPVRERARFTCTVERTGGNTTARFVSAGTPSVYAGSRASENEPRTSRSE